MPLLQKILIKYHNSDLKHIDTIEKGDWIDLRAAEKINLKAGEAYKISLGVSMQLPPGYEAHVRPRSSTFKTWKILLVNSVGVIDNSYNGDNDIWFFEALAVEDTTICVNDRICQFRIVEKQPTIQFETVEHLGNSDRGGYGSTGTN